MGINYLNMLNGSFKLLESLRKTTQKAYHVVSFTGILRPQTLKNLGRLRLAYTELQGGFYMLQLISSDSRHFTQPELSLGPR